MENNQDFMKKQELIESILAEYPVCEYSFGDTDQIPFSDKVLVICETDCSRYGHCWACPPHAGNIYENMEKCRSYQRFVLFSTVWEVPDAYNIDVCAEAQRSHATMTREMRKQVEAALGIEREALTGDNSPEVYFLSTVCSICDVCACPNEPCRHPEERLQSTESNGIVVVQLAEEMGLCFQYGGTIAVYFSMIFF